MPMLSASRAAPTMQTENNFGPWSQLLVQVLSMYVLWIFFQVSIQGRPIISVMSNELYPLLKNTKLFYRNRQASFHAQNRGKVGEV
jgi:hypothetical protein